MYEFFVYPIPYTKIFVNLFPFLATPQFFFQGDGAGEFPLIGTGGIEVFMRSSSPFSAKRGLWVPDL
jgi:hypothetical protein